MGCQSIRLAGPKRRPCRRICWIIRPQLLKSINGISGLPVCLDVGAKICLSSKNEGSDFSRLPSKTGASYVRLSEEIPNSVPSSSTVPETSGMFAKAPFVTRFCGLSFRKTPSTLGCQIKARDCLHQVSDKQNDMIWEDD